MRRSAPRASGFTLVEMLLTLAIVASITGFGVFAGMDAYRTSLIRSEADTIEIALRRARSQAMSGAGGVAHGVCRDDAEHDYELYAGVPGPSSVRLPSSAAVAIDGVPACTSGGIEFSLYSGASSDRRITVTQGEIERAITINHAGWIEAGD